MERDESWVGGLSSIGWSLSMGTITGEVVSCFTAYPTRLSETLTFWDKSGGSLPASVVAGTASDLDTFVEDGLEENIFPHQLGFTCSPDLRVDFPPHIGDDHDVLKGAVATEFSERIEIPR